MKEAEEQHRALEERLQGMEKEKQDLEDQKRRVVAGLEEEV